MVAIELWIHRTRILLVCFFMSSEVRVGRWLHSIMILVSVGRIVSVGLRVGVLDVLLECGPRGLCLVSSALLGLQVTIYSVSAEDVIIE